MKEEEPKNEKYQYSLYLLEGKHFHTIQRDYQTIYENFDLVSYLSQSCEVKVKSRYRSPLEPFTVDTFCFSKVDEEGQETVQKYYLFEMARDKGNPDTTNKIQYILLSDQELVEDEQNDEWLIDQQNKQAARRYKIYSQDSFIQNLVELNPKWKPAYEAEIKKNLLQEVNNKLQSVHQRLLKQQKHELTFQVVFEVNTYKNTNLIVIHISDRALFWRKNLHSIAKSFGKTSSYIQLREEEIEYYYQEPEDVRTIIPNKKHISMALQGGGVKGISYVGAYRALIEENNHEYPPFESIIGSSAGGILAMAIACQMTPNQIQQIVIQMLAPIPQIDKNISPEKEELNTRTIERIQSILRKSKILSYNVFDLITSEISKALPGLFQSMETSSPSILELISYFKQGKRQLYIQGLVEAELMKGEQIEEIGVRCLKSFLKRKFGFDIPNKAQGQFSEDLLNKLNRNLKRITMKQFYTLSGLEFTCTSVDLKDHILRFFNHKTSPGLPVCKAIRMTGSFPVGFGAQTWSKDWGKYFIHYENSRREINLAGHKFTDGGMLSNFPIKYLDNQNMRPMYFSRKKIQKDSINEHNFTVMVGFGLQTKERIEEKAEQVKESGFFSSLFSKVGQVMKHVLSLPGNVFTSASESWDSYWHPYPIEEAWDDLKKEMPLIDFALSLIETYMKSKDNLVKQCLGRKAFKIKDHLKQFNSQAVYKKMLQKIRQQLKKKNEQVQRYQEQGRDLIQLLINNIEQIPENIIYFQQIRQQTSKIVYNIFILYQKQAEKQKIQFNPFAKILKQLEKIEKLTNLFNLELMPKLYHELNDMKAELIQLLRDKKSHEKQINIVEKVLKQIFFDEKNDLIIIEQQVLKNIDLYIESDEGEFYSQVQQLEKYLNFSHIETFSLTLKSSEIKQLMEMWKSFLQIDLYKINKIKAFVQTNEKVNIVAENYCNNFLHKYRKSINSNKGVHIVLESAPFSEIYSTAFIKNIEKSLECYNQNKEQKVKITWITSSNYNSILMFLYAAFPDLDKEKGNILSIRKLIIRNKEIDDIKNLTDPKLDWAKTTEVTMKELKQEIWENQKQFFDIPAEQLDKLKTVNSKSDYQKKILFEKLYQYRTHQFDALKRRRAQFEFYFDKVYEYTVDSILYHNSEQDLEEQVELIVKKMSLKLNEDSDFAEKNISQGKFCKAIMDMIIDKWEDLIRILVTMSPFIRENLRDLEQCEKKDIWKGLLINKAVLLYKVQKFIFHILKDRLHLSENTTLAEFYSACPKKVGLNFIITNKSSSRLTFINYKTKPNMPIWAAIFSSMALPFFTQDLVSDNNWQQVLVKESEIRTVLKRFQRRQRIEKKYVSGDVLTKLPYELITNIQAQSYFKINQSQFVLPLCFDFIQSKNKSHQVQKPIKLKQISWSTIISLATSIFTGGASPSLSALGHVNFLKQRADLLNTYVSSHDNLITEIYVDQLILLPIRIDTLDFHLVLKDPGSKELSVLAKDTIEQSFYVSKECLNNRRKYFKGMQERQKKIMYFKLEGKKPGKRGEQKCWIRFYSLSNPCRGLEQMYEIELKTEYAQKFRTIEEQYTQLQVGDDKKLILIQFTYPVITYRYENGEAVISQARTELKNQYITIPYLKEGESHVYKINFTENYQKDLVSPEEQEGMLDERHQLLVQTLPSDNALIDNRVWEASSAKKLDFNYCYKCFKQIQKNEKVYICTKKNYEDQSCLICYDKMQSEFRISPDQVIRFARDYKSSN